jgi:hypothetical protein
MADALRSAPKPDATDGALRLLDAVQAKKMSRQATLELKSADLRVTTKLVQTALAENELQNSRQTDLESTDRMLTRQIVDYLALAARSDPALAQSVQQSIADARLTDTEKAEVLGARRDSAD